jgi:hypothetical protein
MVRKTLLGQEKSSSPGALANTAAGSTIAALANALTERSTTMAHSSPKTQRKRRRIRNKRLRHLKPVRKQWKIR